MKRTSLKNFLLAGLVLAVLQPQALASGGNQAPHQQAASRSAASARNAAATRAARLRSRVKLKRPFKRGANSTLPHSWTIAGQTYVSQSEYTDLRNGVMELLKRYPPEKYFFVGLGRDPAPVIAFLQNLGEKDLAVNLPGTSNIQWANAGIQPADIARHVEAAIPEEILKGDRQIVILDVTSSGKTPAVFGPFIDTYLQNRGINKTTVKLAFSWNNVMQGGYGAKLTDWIDTTQWADFTNYYTGKYEGSWTPQSGGAGIAEHQRHSMTPGAQPPTQTSPNYKAFRDALNARMEQDAELDGFLAKHGFGGSLRFERPAPPPKPWKPALTIKFGRTAAPGATALLKLKNPGYEKEQAKAQEKAAKKAAKEKEAQAQGVAAKADGEGDGDGEKAKSKPEPKSYEYLAAREYGELRDSAVKLMGMHSPKKSFYVGIGRTSTPLVAFMENVGRDVGTYLPADGLHRIAKKMTAQNLDQATKQTFFELFDKFLPARVLDGQRDIVLFQQSDTGTSLPFMQALVSEYVQSKGSSTQVHIVALADAAPSTGVPHIDTSKSADLVELNMDKAKAISPYGYFRPGKSTGEDDVLDQARKPKTRTKAYGQFKSALSTRMKADTTLESSLKALFAE